ncbi:hypothetical protein CYMTET_4446 [Cymbomonas tetramitiformis]|uniref:Uncharacterized protein n=1 Tax=Cymbomonas tetramitiformis TaxID=36881 RepID=A0AAE0H2X0_9CHLO|nr:hypothetical protein CYMTET_4446 [Cymbomonas tetramitiformis]
MATEQNGDVGGARSAANLKSCYSDLRVGLRMLGRPGQFTGKCKSVAPALDRVMNWANEARATRIIELLNDGMSDGEFTPASMVEGTVVEANLVPPYTRRAEFVSDLCGALEGCVEVLVTDFGFVLPEIPQVSGKNELLNTAARQTETTPQNTQLTTPKNMAKTANKPRMTCARPSKSDHKTSASEQHRQTPGEAAAGLPTIESMQACDASSDGSESDHSVKITPLVSQEDLRRALDRPINYRKVDSAPTEEIPSLLGHGSAKAAESPLERVTRIYQRCPRATENPEARIYHAATRWHIDRREVLAAEDPPAHALKLGVPMVRGDRLSLIHVRSVTGSSLDPSDTGPTGFPYTGTPQLKIVDLDESIKEVLKYLRYLNALLFDISNSPENIVFDLQHTHVWLNRSGRARQIDLAFQNRPLATFVLFNPVFRLPLHVVPQAHRTCNREQPVFPCIYVWSPWAPVEGPVAGRSVLVYGPQLSGKTIEDVSNKDVKTYNKIFPSSMTGTADPG